MIILYSGEYPGVSAGAKRVALYQKGLAEAGVEADVVSTFRATKGRLGFYFNSFLQPLIAFVTVLRQKNSHKLIFIYDYDWDSLLLIRLATKIKGQKMVLEINEKPGTYYGNRLTELSIVKATNLMFLTRITLPLIDGFIVISDQLKIYLIPFQNAKAKILKVPIIVDPNITALPQKESFVHTPFLLHAGALSNRKDGIIGVFQAFAIVNKQLDNKLHFYLTDRVSPTDVWEEIASIIEQNNLEGLVHFTNRLPERELLNYQQQCSMLILNKPDNEQNRYNFPTKLGEYLRFKKPVIYTPVGEMTNYLKDGFNAFEIPSARPDLLAEKILYILDNQKDANRIAENGFALTQNEFNYQIQGKRLSLFFNEVINGIKGNIN